MAAIEKGNKRIMNGWAFYDWANSVYPLVITTAIFPIFYNGVTVSRDANGEIIDRTVAFFGHTFVNTALYDYVIAASMVMVIILSPLLSGIADFAGKKKFFLKVFCYLGSAACASLFFFEPTRLEWGMLSVFLASVGYWNSIVFYNSYLPEIAEPEDHDKLSAKGFSLGYVGSVLLLILCLVLIQVIGKDDSKLFTQICFVLVAIWWAGFSQITYRRLPANPYGKKPSGNIYKHGFKEIKMVGKEIWATARLRGYLVSFFVFSMGVQTIMLTAQFFGMNEITRPAVDENGAEIYINGVLKMQTGMETSELIITILLIQLIAIPGAYFFSFMSKKLSNLTAMKLALAFWGLVCIYAYFLVHTPVDFYIAAVCIGFVMGGTQSLARSTYSKFLPETEDHASYFSFFDVLEKAGMVIGLLAYGLIEDLTGSMRSSVLSLIVFFVIGLILLVLVPKKEKKIEGKNFPI